MPKRLVLQVALVALVLGLAECGGDADEPNAEPSGSGSARAAEARYPVTIKHAKGTTTIDRRPERIVSLNVQWADALLALGEQPVAYVLDQASLETGPYPWHADRVASSTRIDMNGAIPLERIAALQPDLILVTWLAQEDAIYRTLADIAPTIGLLGGLQVDAWQDQVKVVGQVLGEQDRAAEVVAAVEARIDELANQLPGLAGKTYVAANFVRGDGIYVVADPDDGASRLFYRLGMKIDPDIVALDQQAVGRVKISFEQVGLLDADLVGILTNGDDPGQLPGWNQLNAVRSGGLIDFEFADVVGLNTPTPLSVPYVMELMRPALQAVAGA